MGTAPDAVKRLVDRFDQNRKVFQSGDNKKERLRIEFSQRTCRLRFHNPFFTALGSDMDNKHGLPEMFEQVMHEESTRVAGASKAPGACFARGEARVAGRESSHITKVLKAR